MGKIYQMTKNTCFLCCDNDGNTEDGTPGKPAFKKCDHIIEVGVLDLQIYETENFLKQMKKSKQYAKIKDK
jgi:hypothetical protein